MVLRDKPPALLQASPKGTVPVMVLPNGKVIDESLDIMLWALGENDPDGWMQPETGSAEEMLALIATCDREFKPALDRYKYPDRYEGADAISSRETGSAWLAELDARLAPTGHLYGQQPCLADAAIMPFVRQFAQVDRMWFDAQPWPALQAWLAAWLDSDLFRSIMKKHAPWKEGAGVLFP